MKEYLISFPKNEDWRYLRDCEVLLDQYADSLKIFLDEDIEDLLMNSWKLLLNAFRMIKLLLMTCFYLIT